MINQALKDMRSGVDGVFALLAFKPDWRKHFDMSADGVSRSFIGVVLGLPAFIFLIYGINYFIADNASYFDADASYSLLDAMLSWARFWLVFPIVAMGMVMVLGVKDRYASWLVTHNWTVLLLVHVQALMLALYPAGLADAGAMGQVTSLYNFVRLFIHWRVAHAALGLPPLLAAAAAGVPLIIDWMIMTVT